MSDSTFYTSIVNAGTLNVALANHSHVSPSRDVVAGAREILAAANGASCTAIAFTCRKNAVGISLLGALRVRLVEQGATQTFTATVS